LRQSEDEAGPWDGAVEGLSGLIVLGDAWQSVDVFYALFLALRREGHASLAELVKHRIYELQTEGRQSITGEPFDDHRLQTMTQDRKRSENFFKRARTEAKKWQAARWKYMEKRFAKGEHPDTQADFWSGFRYWKTAPKPRWRLSLFEEKALPSVVAVRVVAMIGAFSIVLILLYRMIRWLRRRFL